MRRWHLLSALAASLVAASCMDGLEGEYCAQGALRTCLCEDGRESLQTCGDSGWAECACGCELGETRSCTCADGGPGEGFCLESHAWSDCQCQVAMSRRAAQGECALGETSCPAVGCVNTAHSASNCGACGNACEGCDRCIRGECTPACCVDETNCGSARFPLCVSLASDLDNCGECGVACADDEECVGGLCVP
jgi:hypothetical protein